MPRDALHLPPGLPPVGLDSPMRRAVAGWLLLALVGLAATLVAGLIELFSQFSPSPQTSTADIAALWWLAMLGGLAALSRPHAVIAWVGLLTAWIGTVLHGLVLQVDGTAAGASDPGLFMALAGAALPVLWLLIRPPNWGSPLAQGVMAAGTVLLLSILTTLLQGLQHGALSWDGASVQSALLSILAATAWQCLGQEFCGRPFLSKFWWSVFCLLLTGAALPVVTAPLLADNTAEPLRLILAWISDILLTGIPLWIGVQGILVMARHIIRWRNPAFLALAFSLLLFLPTVIVPQAAIASLIMAFMGLFFQTMLPALLKAQSEIWLESLSFGLFGTGQTLIALGDLCPPGVLASALTYSGAIVAMAGGGLFFWLALRPLLSRS